MLLLIAVWFFNFSSFAAASGAGRYREIYPAKRDGTDLPSSNNNASTTNATDFIFHQTPPACSDLKAAEFLKDIDRSCAPYIEALNTCSDTGLPTQTRHQLATQFFNCSTALYLGNNTCVLPEFPEVGMLLFHFETWRKDYNNSWMYPPGPAASVTPGRTCKQPEFMPIFNDAISVFFKKVQQTQVNTLAFGSSALPETTRVMVQKYKDASTRAVWAMEKTPIQYLRCVAQRPLEAISSCVSTTIRKLEWLPPGIFVYGGGNKCPSSGILIATTVVTMLIEIIHVGLEIWWYRRRPAEKHFSWIELFRAVIVGAGAPLLKAWVLSKSSLENSLMAALGIFLMTPTAAPITSVMSGIFLGKGFGSQILLIDTIVSMAAFILMGTYADMLQGPRVPVSIAGPDRPEGLWLIYLGLYLTTIPGFVFGALYFLSGILMQVLIFLAWIFRLKVFAKVAARIWCAWICFFAFFLACPFLAVWEVFWKVFVKDKEREFPPLRFFRGLFAEGGHWLAWLGRYVVYWVWAGLMFTVFLGRWMFLVNVLQQAGDAFCPASLTPAVVSGMMLTLVAVAGNFALSVLGWRV